MLLKIDIILCLPTGAKYSLGSSLWTNKLIALLLDREASSKHSHINIFTVTEVAAHIFSLLILELSVSSTSTDC